MNKLISAVITTGAIVATNVYAQSMNKGMDMGGIIMDVPAQVSGANTLTDGEVKAVSKPNKTITLKHGAIKSATVQMPPMTMTFPVRDSSLIESVKQGDKVKFNVELVQGTPTVTALNAPK